MKSISRKISLAALSGVLAFLAFPPFEFTYLAWVCLVPLFLALKETSLKSSFWYSYLAGLVFFGGLLSWLVNVTIPGTIILVLFLSLFYGAFGLIANICLRYSMDLFVLPFAWVVIEYTRGGVFSGFPWGLLGHAQYREINLIQIADITGAYGVSFLMVAFNVAAYALFTRAKRRIAYMVLAFIFLVMATAYSAFKTQNFHVWGNPEISVVQGNVPQLMKWDPHFAKSILENYNELTKEAARDKPDMIVWPETSYPYLAADEENPAKDIGDLSKKLKTPILAGVIYEGRGGYYNSAMLFDKEGSLQKKYLKLHLVPFGEYVPFEEYISFLRGYIDKPIGDFERGDEFTFFRLKSVETEKNKPDGSRMRQTNFYSFGALICFEDIFPYIAREYARKGANFLVNMTNDAWFGDTGAPRQHLQSSVFRAVENRTPVIRAANTGVSCFVDSNGAVLSVMQEGGKEVLVRGHSTGSVKVLRGRTFYTRYGDVFVYFCAFMVILLFVTEKLLTPTGSGQDTGSR